MTVRDLALTISAVLAAATAIGMTLRWVVKRLKGFDDFLEDWHGQPPRPGVPARLGVLARLERLDAQVHPNHGGSLRDVADRIERQLTDHINDPDAHQGPDVKETDHD
ncbi:hypothetical protein LO763_22795 [Glycomyces sp. A-F 0318]|uniref:hypothetical protein n=1 Tax=Glycomyces amatae TaxID=2881355 RepID=UPI001E4F457A|nr:hypothetical protein [Glycomyces amatae]MCD0446448.1 hypothetical protein [Glycomyces amatae]